MNRILYKTFKDNKNKASIEAWMGTAGIEFIFREHNKDAVNILCNTEDVEYMAKALLTNIEMEKDRKKENPND